MSTICGVRIIFGRFLALYRWNLKHQMKSVSPSTLSRQLHNQQMLSSTLLFLENVLKSTNNKKRKENSFSSIFYPKLSAAQQKKYLYKKRNRARIDVFSFIINNSFLSRDVRLSFSNNRYIKIIKRDKFFIKIRIHSDGSLDLSSFSVVSDVDIKSKLSRKFINEFSQLVRTSPKPIEDSQEVLEKLYIYGQYLRIINLLIKFQNNYNFELIEIGRSSVLLKFSRGFGANGFVIRMTDSGIFLVSENILSDSFYSKNITYLCGNEIESLINELKEKIIQTKLKRFWNNIKDHINAIRIPDFKGQLTNESIVIKLYNEIMCIFFIDRITGETTLLDMKNHSKLYVSLIPIIEKGVQNEVAVRIIFIHSLASILFGYSKHFQTDLLNPDIGPVKLFHQQFYFTASPNTQAQCYQQEGQPFFIIETPEGEKFVSKMAKKLLTNINYLYPLRSAASSIKITALFIQFAQALRTRGIPTFIDKSRIRFVLDPFDSIVFKISKSFSWSLKFIKPGNNPQKTIIFHGNSITARFAEWLVFFVANVSTLLQMRRQVSGVFQQNSIITSFDIVDTSNFSISFNYKDQINECSTLQVSLEPLFEQQEVQGDIYLYRVLPNMTPTIQFTFSQFIPLKRHLSSLLKSGSICFLFGSFLNCSLIPLLHFHRVFMQGENSKNWSVTALRDDGSFFLVYQRKMSINFMLRPSQIFQLIIPSVGKSKVLQIPLEALPRPCHLSKLSHTTLKLHVDQLENFKFVIERFFGFREKLHDIGFESFRSNGAEVISPFPRSVSYVDINCYMRPAKVEFKIDGEPEIAKNLDTILNNKYKDTDTHMMVVRFIINILDFDQRFVAFIMAFMAKMVDRTLNFGIDWKTTMELTAVTLAELKVFFNFTTEHGHFTVELTKKANDSTPDILCYDRMNTMSHLKSLKELGRWIQALDQSESE